MKRFSLFLVAVMMLVMAEPGVAALFDYGSELRNQQTIDSRVRRQAQESCVSILDTRIAAALKTDLTNARTIANARCQLLTGLTARPFW